MIWAPLLALVAACADDGGPRLDMVTPVSAPHNATITLAGQRLCGSDGDCAHAAGEVVFGISPPQLRAPTISLTDDSVQVAVPLLAGAGTTELTITVDDHTSNALSFEVLP